MRALIKVFLKLSYSNFMESIKSGQEGNTSISSLQKLLLICGILSSLLYVTATIVGAIFWESYSTVSQSVSELFAIEAPSRPFVTPLLAPYGPLTLAFGLGLWLSAGDKKIIRILAGLMLLYGIVNLIASFFPMHLVGAVDSMTLTDKMHILLTTLTVLLILAMIGFGAFAFGKKFRLYSLGTLLLVFVFGIWAGLDGPRMAAHLPAPWMGIKERINIFGFLLWVAVLAVEMLGTPSPPQARDKGAGP